MEERKREQAAAQVGLPTGAVNPHIGEEGTGAAALNGADALHGTGVSKTEQTAEEAAQGTVSQAVPVVVSEPVQTDPTPAVPGQGHEDSVRKPGTRSRRAPRKTSEEKNRELAEWLAETTAERTADKVLSRLEEHAAARRAEEAGNTGDERSRNERQPRFGCLVQAVFLLVLVSCTNALAATSFGDMADNIKGELSRFGPLLQAGFALGGFFLVGLGLWQLWSRSQQPGQPKGGAIMAIIIGCGLLGAATVAQMGAGSLGTGTPELSEIGL